MTMDARKQRVLQAIVALYGLEGEPVGSSVLANYFDMAVSSATLRNEMAALTKLGLLEQPHTSAGRVPSAKGYRYYLDHLLTDDQPLDRVTRARVDAVFASLDHEPEKLAQGAAKALAAISGCTAAVSTPCAEDLCIAHYEVVQVGRSAAAVLAVTTAGYVRTRVARVRTGLSRENAAALAALLNRNLTFVAPVDLSPRLLAELCSQISPELVPVISAAAAILQDSTQPHVYLGGEQYLLDWPQLDGKVGSILSLLNDEEQAAALIAPPAEQSESILLGEDLEPQIPGLCIVSDRYLVGGGLWGSVALIGPTRMPFQKLMPLLHTFADQLGEGMSGKRKDTPQAEEPAVEPNTAEQAAPETAPEQAAAPETNAEAADPKKKDGFFNKKARELEAVKAKLDAAEKNANQAKDQLLRMAAEYENYRKRSTREADQKFNDGVSFAVNQIIPILDTLEMAANAPTTDENYKKGVTMTLDKAAKALSALHVEEIEALGKPFDPNFMSAVQQIPAPDGQESGTVITVYQKGYKLGDKIVRHATVVVAE